MLGLGFYQPKGNAAMMISPLFSWLHKRKTEKAAGLDLPKSMVVAVSPTAVRIFGHRIAGYRGRGDVQEEVAARPRGEVRVV